jgi:alkylated DNA repair protein (DNA oxidative demethylase)
LVSNSLNLYGIEIYKAFLDRTAQEEMLADIRGIVSAAPLFSPLTAWNKPMSVRMTSAGKYGWFSDRKGYRYIDTHPSGKPWPPIPASIAGVWENIVGGTRHPDCCLINFYQAKARMGLHQDKDEADFTHPVLSISLGDPGLFRIGGTNRSDPTKSTWLESGDVLVMGGDARLAFHGIDRIKPGSDLLKDGGRINLTLRVVD